MTHQFIRSPADLTPEGTSAALSHTVVGQERAKNALANAGYVHLLRQVAPRPEDLPRPVVLLIGPTGSGKTLLIRTLARAVGLPFISESASHFSKVGYVGHNIHEIASLVTKASNHDRRLAEAAVIHLDEVDKVTAHNDNALDVSGAGVQEELLTVIEGAVCRSSNRDTETTEHDTSKNLFLLSGAFVGLEDIVTRRLCVRSSRAGFSTSADDTSVHSPLQQVMREDLVQFGFLPELANRITTIVTLEHLTEDELVSVLQNPASSPLQKAKDFFELHGVKLSVPRSALRALAARAHERGGARLLSTVVEETLRDVTFNVSALSRRRIKELRLDRNLVLHEVRRRSSRCDVSPLQNLKKKAVDLIVTARRVTSSRQPTATVRLSSQETLERIEKAKRKLDWDSTTGQARKWWKAFEEHNRNNLGDLLGLCEELNKRGVTITEFFLSYAYSGVDSIPANLHYLDYRRLKRAEELERQRQHRGNASEHEIKDNDCADGRTNSNGCVDLCVVCHDELVEDDEKDTGCCSFCMQDLEDDPE